MVVIPKITILEQSQVSKRIHFTIPFISSVSYEVHGMTNYRGGENVQPVTCLF